MPGSSSESPPVVAASSPESAPFFSVSITKLIALSTCTLGLYELFWFYKNWRLVRERESSDILPFWRAFFGLFFCYPLFRRVRDFPVQSVATENLPAGALTVGWIVAECLWKLPGAYWLISFSSVLFIVPVQLTAARVNEAVAPGHDRNERFSPTNWVTIVLGTLFLVLVVIGEFLPEQPAA